MSDAIATTPASRFVVLRCHFHAQTCWMRPGMGAVQVWPDSGRVQSSPGAFNGFPKGSFRLRANPGMFDLWMSDFVDAYCQGGHRYRIPTDWLEATALESARQGYMDMIVPKRYLAGG